MTRVSLNFYCVTLIDAIRIDDFIKINVKNVMKGPNNDLISIYSEIWSNRFLFNRPRRPVPSDFLFFTMERFRFLV